MSDVHSAENGLVTQTILAKDELVAEGVYGNCMQAAMASLLGKSLDAVPHFGAFTWWPGAMTLWLHGEGLDMTRIDAPPIPQERALLVGKSPRNNAHMVVSEGGEIVWDPHPTRGGLVEVTGAILVHPWETNPDAPCWVCGHTRITSPEQGVAR